MSLDQEIQNQFKSLTENIVQTFPAKVIAVDKADNTITVIDTHEIEYDDVRLTAIVDNEEDSIVLFPKVGSWVLVTIINNIENELFVSKFSEVESLIGKIKKTNFLIDTDGYEINRDGESLKEVIDDTLKEVGKLCDEVSKIVVSIGVTPNVPVITIIKQKVTIAIKQRLNKILK